MLSVYKACETTVRDMVENIKSTAKSWIEFQNSNLLQNADMEFVSAHKKSADWLENIPMYAFTNTQDVYQTIVPGTPSLSGRSLGLVNGEGSVGIINTAIDNFVSNIKTSVNDLYSKFDVSSAFIGNGQAEAIEEYIISINTAVNKLIDTISQVKEAVTQLGSRYTEKTDAIVNEYKSVAKDIGPVQGN